MQMLRSIKLQFKFYQNKKPYAFIHRVLESKKVIIFYSFENLLITSSLTPILEKPPSLYKF